MQMQEPPGGSRTPERELDAYLRGFQQLAAAYGERAMALAPDSESRPLVAHYTRVLQEQIGAVSDQVRSMYDGASDQIRSEVDQLLRMTGARTLVEGAMGPMDSMRSTAAFLPMGPIFRLIKKILELVFEYLLKGVQLPFDIPIKKILELIDELFGEQATTVSDAAGERIHRSEVKFMELQYHMARVEQVDRATREREERNGV